MTRRVRATYVRYGMTRSRPSALPEPCVPTGPGPYVLYLLPDSEPDSRLLRVTHWQGAMQQRAA